MEALPILALFFLIAVAAVKVAQQSVRAHKARLHARRDEALVTLHTRSWSRGLRIVRGGKHA